MSAARDLLTDGACSIMTEWGGRGVVLGTRISLGGDVLVSVSPGFAAAPDGAAVALHRERVNAALESVRRAQRWTRRAALMVAALPMLAAGVSAGLANALVEGLLAYAWTAGAALVAALLWRRAWALGLRLGWRVVQRRLLA